MADDPREIADWLIERYGLEGAEHAALNGLLKAQDRGKLYDVSVWREVRRILSKRHEADKRKGSGVT